MASKKGLDFVKMEAEKDFKGLVKALGSKDFKNKELAARCLGNLAASIQEPYIVDALIGATTLNTEELLRFSPGDYSSAVRIRIAAIITLGKVGDQRAFEPLQKMIPTCDSDERAAVAFALGELGYKHAIYPLTKLAADSDGKVRKEAAVAMGKLGSILFEPDLVKLLSDKDFRVQKEAAISLGKLGGKSAIKHLAHAATHDDDPEVCIAAATALEKLGDKQGFALLEKLMSYETSPIRQQAAEALGDLGDARAAKVLAWAAAHDTAPDVRSAAESALKKLEANKA